MKCLQPIIFRVKENNSKQQKKQEIIDLSQKNDIVFNIDNELTNSKSSSYDIPKIIIKIKIKIKYLIVKKKHVQSVKK